MVKKFFSTLLVSSLLLTPSFAVENNKKPPVEENQTYLNSSAENKPLLPTNGTIQKPNKGKENPNLKTEYEATFSFLPAGKVVIFRQEDKVIVEGKTSGIIGWFYHYKFKFVFNLKESRGFLYQEENGKKKFYDFKKLMEKKPWLPVLVKILFSSRSRETNKPLKVGKLKIIPVKVNPQEALFLVEGSKKVKEVILKGWKKPSLPEEIEIKTSAGWLVFKKES